MMRGYPAPRRLQAVDLSMPAALATLIELRGLTDRERHMYNGFALRRLEMASQELQRLAQARTKTGAG